MELTVKYGDTDPEPLQVNMDCTGGTLLLKVQRKVAPPEVAPVIVLPIAWIDQTVGRFNWMRTENDLEVGSYNMEAEVTTALGKVVTFPKKGFDTLTVGRDLRSA